MPWTNKRVKQRPKRVFLVWLKRLCIGSVLLVLLFLISTYAFQAYYTSTAIRRYLPPDIPLAVLSASKFDDLNVPAEDQLEYKNNHTRLQADLAGQSANSYQYTVPNCGHAIFIEKPAVVVDSIWRVVESVRNHTKLTAPDQ